MKLERILTLWIGIILGACLVGSIFADPPVLPVVAPMTPDGPYLQGATNESSAVISPLVGHVAARTNVFWFRGETRKVGIHETGATVYRQYGRELSGHSALFMFNGKEHVFPFDGWRDRNISRLFVMRAGRPVFVETNEVTITVNTPEPL